MNAHSIAARRGYPYIRGEGKPDRSGTAWLSRFTRHGDGRGPALYVGFKGKRTIIERGNPRGRRRLNPEGEAHHRAPQHHESSGGGSGSMLLIIALGVGAFLLLRGGTILGTGALGPGGMPVFTPANLPPGTIVGTPGTVPPTGYRQVGVTSTGQPVYAPSSGVGSILSTPGIATIAGGIITGIGGVLGRIFGGGGSGGSSGGGGGIGTADILRPAPGDVPTQSVGTVSIADINRPVDVSTWIDPSSGTVALGPTAPDPNMVPVDLTGSTWFNTGTGELVVSANAPGANFVPWDLPPGGYDVTLEAVGTGGGDWFPGEDPLAGVWDAASEWWGAIA